MTGVSKRFPGVRALEDVHLEVGAGGDSRAARRERRGQVDAAENPLRRACAPTRATIELFGEPVAFATPHDAQRAGIVTIYQEFTLAPDMSIAENVFIGREPGSRLFVSWRQLADETRAITERIGLKRDPMTLVRDLSVAEQQLVEIARALSMRSRLIVMDEPTSALSEAEVANLAAHHPHAEGRGAVDHLRHPSARGGVPPLRPLHRAARRPFRRLRTRSPRPMSTRSSA